MTGYYQTEGDCDVSTRVFMVEETVLLDLSEQLPRAVVMGLHVTQNVDWLVKIIHEVVSPALDLMQHRNMYR